MDENMVNSIVQSAVEVVRENFTQQMLQLTQAIQNILPQKIEPHKPVTIVEGVQSTHTDLSLIKSLPEFKGKMSEYPAWRNAAKFALSYYSEGSEPYYIAMGILRNKISSSANENLSAFNTPLNFKAIIARLDQLYADKRPLHILENQLNTLRQGQMSIDEYYDAVDRQLTLIVNKINMTHSNNDELTNAFNEKARENALRVFISGLKRPLCDTLFAANPPDLPSALAVAQELHHNRQRYEFAQTYATGRMPQNSHIRPFSPKFGSTVSKRNNSQNFSNQSPTPMDVDPGSSCFRRQTEFKNNTSGRFSNGSQPQTFRQKNNSGFQNSSQRQRTYNTAPPQQQYSNLKRHGTNSSIQAPINKQQRVNAMKDEPYFSEVEDFECEDNSADEINFLG
uniref:Retrovirus-related Gag polyprotein from transposon gypsy n=1 Tax=Ceratitis capitata TaxID=7213 RepID=W8BQH7_CERCA